MILSGQVSSPTGGGGITEIALEWVSTTITG